ncbi:MAG TPA: glycosyltransferase family 4 protein [Candidatus Nitrosotenuis sp.]|nr:glycosyltransferase family 4 protein [Candidatus Nitrosotenuis sp.]
MKIYYFTGGAAGMYCGSCIRDNALAAELIRQGHNVLLLPVYTPTLTDEENVSHERVFLSGLSVYLEQHFPLIRRTPKWMDVLWDWPPMIRALTKLSISNRPEPLAAITVSLLRGENGYQNKEIRKLLDWLRAQPRPDVVSLPFSLLISLAEPIRRALRCAVTVTLQGEDLFLNSMPEPYRSEALRLIRAQHPAVDAFISMSGYYADFMAGFLQIPREKIHVVPLGLRVEGYDRAPREEYAPFTVGYFARIAPEKGLDVLAEAYRLLRQKTSGEPMRLEAAGYLAPEHRSYLAQVQQSLRGAQLEDEFRYHGAMDRQEKIRFLQSLDVFSVPEPYAEPKGLSVLEAMACGVPVVQPNHGAFPEILARTGGGLLFEPGHADDLAEKLFSLWKNREMAAELGSKGYAGMREHFSVAEEARRAVAVFEKVSGLGTV